MRILAGPDNWRPLTKYWRQGLEGYDLLVFGGGRDTLQYNSSTTTFQDILSRLPAGWVPDLVIWWLPERQSVLPGLIHCPYPTLAQICHWHTVTDFIVPELAQFDLVATDRRGVTLLATLEGPVVFEAPLFGFDPERHKRLPECPRVYDVTHAGDLNPFAPELATLAHAATGLWPEFSLRYVSGPGEDDCARLHNQSRVTLNPGGSKMRCYEAAACGSLVFCQDQSHEHCVQYDQENLVELLRFYLQREEERAVLAQAAYDHVQQFSYRLQGHRLVEMALAQAPTGRRRAAPGLPYLCSVEQAGEALAADPDNPELCNRLGCIEAAIGAKLVTERRWPFLADAVTHLSRALSLGLMARLSLAHALLRAYRKDLAAEVLLEAAEAPFREIVFFPRNLGALHTLWEREPENRERSARWQLFELLSQLVPVRCVEFCRMALAQRSDMATTWFRLALRLAPGSPDREQALEQVRQLAPTFLAAQSASGAQALLAAFPDLEASPRRSLRAVGPGRTLEEFLQGISFDWLQPSQSIPPLFRERAGSELEYTNTFFPQDDETIKQRFARLESVPRMSTLAISAVLNRVVADMPADQVFVHVGIWHGFTLLSSLLDNPDKSCVGIDNFSQFGGPKEEFLARFERLRGPAHEFHAMDYREYFAQHHSRPLGVYFYDGEHSYANQFEGLQVAEPYFAEGCIVLVDDTNWQEPRQASLDFVAQSARRYELLFDVRTAENAHPTWWNGFMVFRCVSARLTAR